jgi:hypothetical protein
VHPGAQRERNDGGREGAEQEQTTARKLQRRCGPRQRDGDRPQRPGDDEGEDEEGEDDAASLAAD